MSVYGDMLLYWPEQRRSIIIFTMTAKINGGWTKDLNSDIDVSGVIQNIGGDRLKESNGNLALGAAMELWTETANLDGYFTTWQGKIYRLNSSNDWESEGGFYRYGLEKVVGNNGTESDNATWNIGVNSFC